MVSVENALLLTKFAFLSFIAIAKIDETINLYNSYMKKEDVLQPVDDNFKRLTKTLLRTARFGALACLEPETGIPLASRISCCTAMDGAVVFLISSLAPHFAALEGESRCSLLLGEPGKGDPLAYARITLIGTAQKICEDDHRSQVRHRFLRKHPKAELYVDFGDFAFWQLNVDRALLNGGFGKACELGPDDILTDLTTCAELKESEAGAVAHMNDDHLDAIHLYATKLLNQPDRQWKLASFDPEGLDLIAGDTVQRYWFDPPLERMQDLRPGLVELAKLARTL